VSEHAPVRPAVLVVLDGWGLRAEREANAIALARTPAMDRLGALYPHASLLTSGEAVGLPAGQMGNSEVGHMNMGAGRIVYQELTRITKAIRDGDFVTNRVLTEVVDHAARNADATLHLLGLLSDGGVHSHIAHLDALLRLARDRGARRVAVHAILDGRDVPPRSALEYVRAIEHTMSELGVGEIATVAGRYYTMDRDKRWDRLRRGYDALVLARGESAASAEAAVRAAYARDENDEFVLPTVVRHSDGHPRARIEDGDQVFVFNFRPDRAREITRALSDPEFAGFPRERFPHAAVASMTMYDATLNVPVAFPPQFLDHTIGELVAERALAQLRIAETEKYAHVTYFFSGGVETPFAGEDRRLIPSPHVATYDLQPEMSAPELAEEVVARIRSQTYALVVCNFANADMVGHTGILPAAIAAIESVDHAVGRIVSAVEETGAVLVVTADHGNAELMVDPETGEPHTAHTTNPVPIHLLPAGRSARIRTGRLADVAPTLLDLMGIPQHPHMTGESLLVPHGPEATSLSDASRSVQAPRHVENAAPGRASRGAARSRPSATRRR
jgi:2,3-bisphosphoglycerate-independent phosphoglycerate mutase